MKFDYIVPEATGHQSSGHLTTVAFALLALSIVGYLVDGEPKTAAAATDTSARPMARSAAASLQEIHAQRGPAPFLSELRLIGSAHAMAPRPITAIDLPKRFSVDLPVPAVHSPLASTTQTHTAAADAIETAAAPVSATAEAVPAEPQTVSKLLSVKEGDSLSLLFDRHQLKAADWIALSKVPGAAKRLRRLQPGDTLSAELNHANEVMSLRVRLDDASTLQLDRTASNDFALTLLEDELEVREITAQGIIDSSLFLSAKSAGLSDRLTMELTDIFAWDVDFALDIRASDSFSVLYEEIYRDGKKLKDGNILAAEFINRDRTIRALRYTNEAGVSAYYSPQGEPMKKAFLRSPVDFTRISSRFSNGRKHPILNKIRAHKGVDYAAAGGTPVKAAGAGKVVFAGVKGGYGNVLIIQHAGKYKTLYAHLQNFRRGIRRGVSVSQGQTIGYVGMTGLATGPHLHYEFQIDNRHVNPLTVKLPSAPKIAAAKLELFKSETAILLSKLDAIRQNAPLTEIADAR